MAVSPEGWVAVAALGGAATALAARRIPGLRSVLGSALRTWVAGAVIVAVLIASTFALEATFGDGDEYQYLGSVLLAFWGTITWALAGAIVLVTTPLRRRWPVLDMGVHGALAATIVAGVALWGWLAYVAVAWDL